MLDLVEPPEPPLVFGKFFPDFIEELVVFSVDFVLGSVVVLLLAVVELVLLDEADVLDVVLVVLVELELLELDCELLLELVKPIYVFVFSAEAVVLTIAKLSKVIANNVPSVLPFARIILSSSFFCF